MLFIVFYRVIDFYHSPECDRKKEIVLVQLAIPLDVPGF